MTPWGVEPVTAGNGLDDKLMGGSNVLNRLCTSASSIDMRVGPIEWNAMGGH